MSTAPRPVIRRDIRVFISAVTGELGSVRKLVKKALEDNDYHAVEQDNFPPDYRNLIDKLRERIASCDAVIHIVGHCYGAEPIERPAGARRRSYTQLEYDTAVELDKRIYVFLTGKGFTTDPHKPELTELEELQSLHRRYVSSTGKDYNPTAGTEQLDQKIRSLQIKVERLTGELQTVDQQVSVTGRRLGRGLAGVALVGLAALVAVIVIAWRQQIERRKAGAAREEVGTKLTSVDATLKDVKKRFADPDVLSEDLKSYIRKRADEEIAAAKEAAPDDWKKRDEIEKRRDQTLANVDDLIARIRKGLAGQPDPIFVEAAGILEKHGVDESIEYLERKQPAIEKQISAAKSLRDEAEERLREAYRPKVLQADLYESNLKWDAALKIRNEVARDNPRWCEARSTLGNLLYTLAKYGEAEPQLRAAVELAANPAEEAFAFNSFALLLKATNHSAEAEPLFRRALASAEQFYGPVDVNVVSVVNNLASLLTTTNRRAQSEPLFRRALAIDAKLDGLAGRQFAGCLNNFALLLFDTDRWAEAEPLLRRALEIVETNYQPSDPEVARDLGNLANLLHHTNRIAAAEPISRRALAINERLYGPDHPAVARCLSNLAMVLRDTKRLPEAESLVRRAIGIDEQSYRPDDPVVAVGLNNLAKVLVDTSRPADAEPLLRRALAIQENSNGPRHAAVAAQLCELAKLLEQTNRMADAEPLYRRALAIDEQSFGPDHHAVAIDLGSLAQLLRDTKRLELAEPFYRRALVIAERTSGPDHPDVAGYLNGLSMLLLDSQRAAEADILMTRAVRLLAQFGRSTGHEHPSLSRALDNFGQLLVQRGLSEPEIAARIKAICAGTDKLSAIVPEVDRLLGPSKPVDDVLAFLDRQYQTQGKRLAYLLKPDEPIVPHLDELLRPSAAALMEQVVATFRAGVYADSVLLCEAALELMGDDRAYAPEKIRTRGVRAVAWRELGLVEQARDELLRLHAELERLPSAEPLQKGQTRYHLAICQWLLGDRLVAQRTAEESLAAYDSAPKSNPIDPGTRRRCVELLANLKNGKTAPPRAAGAVEAQAALEVARARYRARADLTKLALDQKAGPLLDQLLGPANPAKDVLAALDRQYHEQGKPAIWFLRQSEPITPHLDELIGTSGSVQDVLEKLDRQYREQGKPAIWNLPLGEPLTPHLDELLGKSTM